MAKSSFSARDLVQIAENNAKEVKNLTRQLGEIHENQNKLAEQEQSILERLSRFTGREIGSVDALKGVLSRRRSQQQTKSQGRQGGKKQGRGKQQSRRRDKETGGGRTSLKRILLGVIPASGEEAISKTDMITLADKSGWKTSAKTDEQKITLIGQALHALKGEGLVENESRGKWTRTKNGDKQVSGESNGKDN